MAEMETTAASSPRFLHGSLALLAATNLLYHFPPLLTIMTMSAGGEIELAGEVDAATFRQLFSTPNVLAHTLHFWLASVAVSGVVVFWLARRLADRNRIMSLGPALRFSPAHCSCQVDCGYFSLLLRNLNRGSSEVTVWFAVCLWPRCSARFICCKT